MKAFVFICLLVLVFSNNRLIEVNSNHDHSFNHVNNVAYHYVPLHVVEVHEVK